MDTLPVVKPACGGCCSKLERLSVSFGDHRVLEDVSLHFHCGELTALIGPNGAGKTTLLRAILGEVPHGGALHFLDRSKRRPDRPVIGYVPQKLEFDPTVPLSVLDLFAAALSRWPAWLGHHVFLRRRAEAVLERFEAAHLAGRALGRLSGGELQRVLLALAVTPVPDILLLDEPVSGVDQAGLELFYRMVSGLRRQHDLSILLVSHDLPEVMRYADRIVFINRRVLFDGPPEAAVDDQRMRQTFGLDRTFLERREAGDPARPACVAPHCPEDAP
ncbi:MAG: metal ABC transporter ATP-binding protein [Candidatus Edwardsbacteria bacterium]|jgi:zinc transport system ATP-binding protein|nr:metal ABC transporter ATP-binding protein [Candidatus Edwardsbacteria bacterium]